MRNEISVPSKDIGSPSQADAKPAQEDIQALIASVNRLVRAVQTASAPVLWDVADIAQWMGMSERTVQLRVVTREGFPDPFVPTGVPDARDGRRGNAQKRWFAEEVIEWARLHRASLDIKRRPGRKRGTHD